MVIDKRISKGFIRVTIPFSVVVSEEESFFEAITKSIHDVCDEFEIDRRISRLEVEITDYPPKK